MLYVSVNMPWEDFCSNADTSKMYCFSASGNGLLRHCKGVSTVATHTAVLSSERQGKRNIRLDCHKRLWRSRNASLAVDA
jgi:hypothetical protein